MSGTEYPKIHAPYKRGDRGRFLVGEWSRPEIGYLASLPWRWTEKVDGTNIRLTYEWNGFRGNEHAFIAGRTDRAQIPPDLLCCLVDLARKAPFESVFTDGGTVVIYGEGYGRSIQKGGLYTLGTDSAGVGFTVFDVAITPDLDREPLLFLERAAVEDIAGGLGLSVAPVLMEAPLADAEAWAAEGIPSTYGKREAEGLVGTPLVPLLTRRGERVVTKVKTKDYRS